MARMIGMGAKPQKMKSDLNPFKKENESLQTEIEKLRKEKKKALEENKVLRKEITLMKKKHGEAKTETLAQAESVE